MLRALISLALLQGCLAPGRDPRPSALLVTLEGVHAGMLEPWGGPPTPVLSTLAAESARWDTAVAVSALGPPNLASLLTGLEPAEHGLRDEAGAVIAGPHPPLAEQLQGAGWRTAAWVGGPAARGGLGLERGFGLWRGPDPTTHPPGRAAHRRGGDGVVEQLLQELPALAAGGEPLFVWVSLGDAVWPQPRRCAAPGPPREAAVQCLDQALGRVLALWDHLRPGGVVVVTADQGGGPGDGGEALGLRLDDSVLRLPLLVRGAGMRPGAVYTHPVSLQDLPRTLTRLLGLPPSSPGRDLRAPGAVPGSEALEPARLGLAPLRALTLPGGRVVRGAWGAWYPAGGGAEPAPDPAAAEHSRQLDAWLQRSGGPSARRPLGLRELLRRPPLALTGRAPEEVLGEDPRGHEAVALAVAADRALRQGRLLPAQRAAGALIGVAPDAEGSWSLQARVLLAQGELAGAAELLAALYRPAPSAGLALALAELAERRGAWEQALAWHDEVLLLEPLAAVALGGQLRALRALGREDEALVLAAVSAPTWPADGAEAQLLAQLLLLVGEPAQALGLLDWAIALDAGDAEARALRAEALLAQGHPERALEELRAALAHDPFHLPLRRALAALLLEQGQPQEALRTLAPAVVRDRDPHSAALYAEAQVRAQAEGAPTPPPRGGPPAP